MMDVREWALKWIEGSFRSYVKGRTHLNMVLGRVKRAVESYGVKENEVFGILELIKGPLVLPSMPVEEKARKVAELKSALEGMFKQRK